MKILAVEQVDEAAKLCIRYEEHWPKPATLLRLCRERQPAPQKAPELPEQSYGTMLVTQMLIAYIHRRRVIEAFHGEINLPERRAKCRDLAVWIDGMRAEDMLPTLEQCKAAFANDMRLVHDVILETAPA